MDINQEKRIFSLLDLTRLQDADNAANIAALCEKAVGPLGHVAAICVYPEFISTVKNQLNSDIRIATVANFPHGRDDINTLTSSIECSLIAGAHEIDVVFPYREYLDGKISSALDKIKRCKELTGQRAILKVILETGVISNLSIIEQISASLIDLGANFLKTSTGKVSVGATIEAAAAMLSVIKASNTDVGFKAAGGIRTFDQAMQYIRLAEDVMGEEWLTAEHFRIGTSGLSL